MSNPISFRGGARRQSRKPLYHLVPIELMEAVGDTRGGGDLKYQPGNWMQGDLAFFIDCINHSIEHLMKAGDLEDPENVVVHLGHAATNVGFMLWAIKRGKLRREDFNNAAVIYKEAQLPDGWVL